jgi:hypothetical protein
VTENVIAKKEEKREKVLVEEQCFLLLRFTVFGTRSRTVLGGFEVTVVFLRSIGSVASSHPAARRLLHAPCRTRTCAPAQA